MEVKPVKNYSIPKFAAVLAAVSIAGTMVACNNDTNDNNTVDETEETTIANKDVQIMGVVGYGRPIPRETEQD